MPISARDLYVIKNVTQNHPALSPVMRRWIEAVNENVDWPTTSTTSSTTSTTSSTTSSSTA